MCRWMAYSGRPVFVEDLLFRTEHSLIDQSLNARCGPHTTNGDGFGLGWYSDRETPGLYRHVQPAWNDANLRDIAGQIRSPLFLAHVRAATEAAVQQTNCHPFRYGRWLFVHNGLIRGFRRIKRRLVIEIAPDLFPSIEGTTDSEVMFHLALTFGLEADLLGGLARMVGFVERVGIERGIERPIQMTIGVSDGTRLVAVRYSSERRSRTLHLSTSPRALNVLCPHLVDRADNAVAVVSEPLTRLENDWTVIDESTAVTLEDTIVEARPFEPTVP